MAEFSTGDELERNTVGWGPSSKTCPRWLGIPGAATAVDDGFALWVETRRAENALNAVRRDEILGIFVAQNLCCIADVDGTHNVSFGIGISRSYVPNNCISRYSLGDIGAIDDNWGRGRGGLCPQKH